MAGVSQGPIPSRLVLLSGLANVPIAEKVRFLGCVTNYSTTSGTLTLEHDFPKGNMVRAIVDVGLLLNTLKANDTQVGEWVHVIGYVTDEQRKTRNPMSTASSSVQAIVLWSAGPVKLHNYEKSLTDQAASQREC